MPNTISGMFGATPEQTQLAIQQADQAQAAQLSQMDFPSLATYGGMTGASNLAGGIGGMLGGQDPRMAEANKIKQVQTESLAEAQQSGIDPSKDVEKFGQIVAGKYLNYGMPDKAFGVQQMIQGMKEQQAKTTHLQAQSQKELALAHKAMQEIDPALKLFQSGHISPAQYAQYKRGEISMDDLKLLEKQSSSSQERMVQQLIEQRMPNASPAEKEAARAAMNEKILSQSRFNIDPISGQMYKTEGVTLPPALQSQGQSGQQTQPTLPVNQVPDVSQGRKPLLESEQNYFSEGSNSLAQLKDAYDTFKDSYAGFGVPGTGEAALAAGKRGFKKYEDMAKWYSSYERWKTALLKSTFGASLTPSEKDQIEKSTVATAQSPEQAKYIMEDQINIIERNLIKRANSAVNSGVNPKSIESYIQPKELPKGNLVEQIYNSKTMNTDQKLRALRELKAQGMAQ